MSQHCSVSPGLGQFVLDMTYLSGKLLLFSRHIDPSGMDGAAWHDCFILVSLFAFVVQPNSDFEDSSYVYEY